MEKITNFLNALSGYKTYTAGIIAVVYGIYSKNLELIFMGLAAMGLRNAIK